MARVQVIDGPKKGHVFPIERDETIVGRLPYCDIVLNENNISRNHSRIVRSGNTYFIEDLNSTNGTFLNGRRLTARSELNDGDRIKVYNISMVFQANGLDDSDSRPSDDAADAAANKQQEKSPPDKIVLPTQTVQSSSHNVGVNAYERLRVILEINKTLGGAMKPEDVLPKILDGMFVVFPQADRGYILIPNETTGALEVTADKYKGEGTMVSSSLGTIPQNVASRVMVDGEAILSADGFDDDEFDIGDSVLDFPIRSMMCAPLIGPLQKPQGIIYVDTSDPHDRFTEEDLEVLISVSASAGQALEYAQSHQAKLKLDRRERELEMAREVQLHFLPRERPVMPEFRFFDYYSSAQEVGGDYYGYVTLPDSKLAVTVGDVAGKGISAALIMAKLCSEVRYRLATSDSLAAAIEYLNLELTQPEIDSWFVTFVVCVLDPNCHKLTIINAGHMPPIRKKKNGQTEQLGVHDGGPPLGCLAEMTYNEFTVDFEPGDSLLLYTDGINEAMDPQRNLYSVDRVRKTFAEGPQDIVKSCEQILADVNRYTNNLQQSDDICMVGIQRM